MAGPTTIVIRHDPYLFQRAVAQRIRDVFSAASKIREKAAGWVVDGALAALPDEVWLIVMSSLDAVSVSRFAIVCKRARRLVADPSLTLPWVTGCETIADVLRENRGTYVRSLRVQCAAEVRLVRAAVEEARVRDETKHVSVCVRRVFLDMYARCVFWHRRVFGDRAVCPTPVIDCRQSVSVRRSKHRVYVEENAVFGGARGASRWKQARRRREARCSRPECEQCVADSRCIRLVRKAMRMQDENFDAPAPAPVYSLAPPTRPVYIPRHVWGACWTDVSNIVARHIEAEEHARCAQRVGVYDVVGIV